MDLNKTIDNKRIFEKSNGDQVVDFTEQNYNPAQFAKIIDFLIVNDDLSMRPDLIAMAAYRDISSTDIIMKQNGISNPFAIDAGELIFLQERREIDQQFSNIGEITRKNQVRKQYLDPDKAPSIDDNLQRFNQREKPKPAVNKPTSLPPNFANFGDQEITFRGGKVIFGEDITDNKEVCEEKTLSKSEFLKRLSKNRLTNSRQNLRNQEENVSNFRRQDNDNDNTPFRSGGTQGGR